MLDRRNFLKSLPLLTAGCIAGERAMAANGKQVLAVDETSAKAAAKKSIGLQTYSLGQELLKDLPKGLARLSKMGYTNLEIFGYREDTGKFGDYSPTNTIFIAPQDYKKMATDAGLNIMSSHLTPMLREYTKENLPKFEEFWKKATDIHAELGVKYMVQPSMPKVENEDDAKQIAEIFNRAGEIAKGAGISWGYHNHNMEFIRVPKAGETLKKHPMMRMNPWASLSGTAIEELFLKNTDPENVCFELDVYWTVMGQEDPVDWLERYPGRFRLLHIKDRWDLGGSGMMNFENIFRQAYLSGMETFFVELEADRKGRTQFEGVEKSARYLQNADFVK